MFPEFKVNPFYITGESYGGKYCPELASLVLDGIQNGSTPWLNMKGVMVGNPGTESDWYGAPDEYAYLTFLYQHMIIPQANYTVAYETCGWSDFLSNCNGDYTDPSIACKEAIVKAISFLPPVLDVCLPFLLPFSLLAFPNSLLPCRLMISMLLYALIIMVLILPNTSPNGIHTSDTLLITLPSTLALITTCKLT